jgi:hypothetical protein
VSFVVCYTQIETAPGYACEPSILPRVRVGGGDTVEPRRSPARRTNEEPDTNRGAWIAMIIAVLVATGVIGGRKRRK